MSSDSKLNPYTGKIVLIGVLVITIVLIVLFATGVIKFPNSNSSNISNQATPQPTTTVRPTTTTLAPTTTSRPTTTTLAPTTTPIYVGDKKMFSGSISGKCMFSQNNENFQKGVFDCEPTYNDQWWKVEPNTYKTGYSLKNVANSRCLSSTKDGIFEASECNADSVNQVWSFIPVENKADNYLIKANDSNKCLFSREDGTFGAFNCDSTYNDQWWNIKNA